MGFDVPGSMSFGEAWRLTNELLLEPSSHVAAAVADWPRPISYEAMTLADLYDLLMAVNKDPKKPAVPYPRPWDVAPKAIGAGTSMTPEQYRALRAEVEKTGDA